MWLLAMIKVTFSAFLESCFQGGLKNCTNEKFSDVESDLYLISVQSGLHMAGFGDLL